MKIRNVLGALLIAASTAATADDIYIGEPGYGGNGCPQGTVSATLSPDAKQLSLLFDAYQVEAGGFTKIARKSCNLAIPIHVPQGLSVSIFEVEFRGYNGLPRGADSLLNVNYFFMGQSGPTTSRTFRGALDDEYYVKDTLAAGALIWSPCGRDVNLRVNSSMRVKTNSAGQQALSTVDSLDLNAGLIYHIQWRTCH